MQKKRPFQSFRSSRGVKGRVDVRYFSRDERALSRVA